MSVKWGLLLCFLRAIVAQDSNCDFYQNVASTSVYNITSPRWPYSYPGGVQCRWIAICPTGYNCRLDCLEISLPQSSGCELDRLLVSKSGDEQLTGAETYCGRGSLSITSTNQKICVGLITYNNTFGGRFTCQLSAQPATPSSQCSCGERRQNRIVGGTPTGINEYKMMVGLARVQEGKIRCGAMIISKRDVLTAAHCVVGEDKQSTAVIVGEHDVTTGDSPATKAYKVSSFIVHSLYSESNFDYDIAIVTVEGTIEFNDRVGPACLPFKFVNKDFAGEKVAILGWGTTEPGAPVSKVLLKADVDVISQVQCQKNYTSLTTRQMCTYTKGKDACQYDSGGPLLYTDPATGLLFAAGIVSYGKFCASGYPGVNTRVTMLLEWIISKTEANFCHK